MTQICDSYGNVNVRISCSRKFMISYGTHPSEGWRHPGQGYLQSDVQSFPLPVSVCACAVPEVGGLLQSWRLCVIGGSLRHRMFWACAGSPQLQGINS